MAVIDEAEIRLETPLKREASFGVASPEVNDRTIELSFSSEEAVLTRSYDENLYRLIESDTYYEILGHDADEMDLSRLNGHGPVLFNHQNDMHVGSVVSARSEDGKGRAKIKFSRSELGESKMRDVEDGILKSVSVRGTVGAYRVIGERDGIPVLRAVKWTPTEISLVTMPEDVSVGVGRSKKEINHRKDSDMGDENKNKPGEGQEVQRSQQPSIDIKAEVKRAKEDERKRLIEVDRAIDFCEIKRELDIPDGTKNKAADEGWGYDQTLAYIVTNQPETKRGADTKVLDDMRRSEKQEFSVCRAINGFISKAGITGFEAEVIQEIERQTGQRSEAGGILIPMAALTVQRSMLAGVFNQGGSTVPVDTGPMIPKLDPVPVVEASGATVLRGLTAPTNFPRHTTAAVAQWVAEAQEVAKSTPGTDDVMLTPHGLAAYVEIGRQLAKTSSIDVEAFVRMEIIRRINLAIDKAALVGPGVDGVPKGIFKVAASLVNEVTFGGAPTWGKVVEFESEIEDQDGLEGTLGFITSASVKGAWKSTSKDSGSGMFLASEGNMANGYPIRVTSQLKGSAAENKVAFGNWAQLLIGMYGAIELFVDQSADLQRRGLIGLTGLAHADVAIRQGKAFARSTDAGNQ